MRVHSIAGLITNSSSEIYSTINAYSTARLVAAIDWILSQVGYAERFHDLFEIVFVPHELFISSRIDFGEVYEEYGVPEQEPTEEEVDYYKENNKTTDGYIFEAYLLGTEQERLVDVLAEHKRRIALYEKVMSGVSISDKNRVIDLPLSVMYDGDYAKPVADIRIRVKATGEIDYNIISLLKYIWDWDNWDYN